LDEEGGVGEVNKIAIELVTHRSRKGIKLFPLDEQLGRELDLRLL